VKPLASPRVEYRLIGFGEIACGAGLGVVAAISGRPGRAVAALSVGVVLIYGAIMYFACRRRVGEAVAAARPAPTSDREAISLTYRRAATSTVITVLVMVLLSVLFGSPILPAGITLGNGVALATLSAWIARREQTGGVEILREPNWSFPRGIMDLQDFYVEDPSRRSPTPAANVPAQLP